MNPSPAIGLLPLLLTPSAAGPGPGDEGEIAFERVYGSPGRQVGNAVLELDDGYVVVGYTEGPTGTDALVLRTDLEGKQLWRKTYGHPGEDYGWDIVGLEDGGLLVSGFTENAGTGDYDVLLMRLDSAGKLVAEHAYGGPGDDRCWSLCSDGTGGFVLAGETTEAGSGIRDVLLLRVDRNGEELWSTVLGGHGDDRVFEVVLTEDGGLVCGGITTTDSLGARDAYVIKVDRDGELEWERRFGGAADDVAHGVTALPGGDVLVTGYGGSFGNGMNDLLLWKLDANGDLLWSLDIPAAGDDRGLTGTLGIDGTYHAIGYSRVFGDWQVTLIHTDADGGLLERRVFSRPGPDRGVAVITTSAGDLVLTGERQRPGQAQADLWLMKLVGPVGARHRPRDSATRSELPASPGPRR